MQQVDTSTYQSILIFCFTHRCESIFQLLHYIIVSLVSTLHWKSTRLDAPSKQMLNIKAKLLGKGVF